MLSATAPAKIIIFGEHAVVYGKPALALPLMALHAEAAISHTNDRFRLSLLDTQQNLYLDQDHSHPLIKAVQLTLDHLKQSPPAVQITIKSNIPIASGLGSGAAVSTAVIRVLYQYLERDFTLQTLNDIVYEIEKLHHGTPSGIDNTVIVYEQPVFFIKGQPIERFTVGKPLHLVIGDTGIPASTRVSVGDVRALYENDRINTQNILDNIGNLVNDARRAIETGDIPRTGKLMLQNHEFLQQLTVSSRELDTLVAEAMNAGALGAKLSGGGRGGNMIALVQDAASADRVRQALIHVGAVRVLENIVQPQNIESNDL